MRSTSRRAAFASAEGVGVGSVPVLVLGERLGRTVGGVEREVVDLGAVGRGGPRRVAVNGDEEVGLGGVGGGRAVLEAHRDVGIAGRDDAVALRREHPGKSPHERERGFFSRRPVGPFALFAASVPRVEHDDAGVDGRHGGGWRQDAGAPGTAAGVSTGRAVTFETSTTMRAGFWSA